MYDTCVCAAIMQQVLLLSRALGFCDAICIRTVSLQVGSTGLDSVHLVTGLVQGMLHSMPGSEPGSCAPGLPVIGTPGPFGTSFCMRGRSLNAARAHRFTWDASIRVCLAARRSTGGLQLARALARQQCCTNPGYRGSPGPGASPLVPALWCKQSS